MIKHTLQTVGLLGGTFNPPHYGHLFLASAAYTQLQLNRVDLMPTGLPWQKKHVLSIEHRLTMCQLAIQEFDTIHTNINLGIETCDIERTGLTYTIDTLTHLTQKNPNVVYTLIVGSDQAIQFDTWKHWEGILLLCRLAIVERNNIPICLPKPVETYLTDLNKNSLFDNIFDTITMKPYPISSTIIRGTIKESIKNKNGDKNSDDKALFNHHLISSLISRKVLEYIKQHHLYIDI